MNKYENGKIYTIRCHSNPEHIYVGSTIQPLYKRWNEHKRYKKNPDMLIYQTINGNFDDWYIELFELFSCNSKEELNKREGEVIREIATLNTNIAGRTQSDWFKENKEHIKEYKRQYNLNNFENIKEKSKIYRSYTIDEKKQYDKQYRQQNSEKIKEYMKKYNLKKKEEKLLQQSTDFKVI